MDASVIEIELYKSPIRTKKYTSLIISVVLLVLSFVAVAIPFIVAWSYYSANEDDLLFDGILNFSDYISSEPLLWIGWGIAIGLFVASMFFLLLRIGARADKSIVLTNKRVYLSFVIKNVSITKVREHNLLKITSFEVKKDSKNKAQHLVLKTPRETIRIVDLSGGFADAYLKTLS